MPEMVKCLVLSCPSSTTPTPSETGKLLNPFLPDEKPIILRHFYFIDLNGRYKQLRRLDNASQFNLFLSHFLDCHELRTFLGPFFGRIRGTLNFY